MYRMHSDALTLAIFHISPSLSAIPSLLYLILYFIHVYFCHVYIPMGLATLVSVVLGLEL